VETAADGGDAQATARALIGFDAAVRRHLALEEEILFPALEDASGMHGVGPTQVMRMEHAQMRGLLDAMARAAAGGDVDGVTDHGDTLMMLIGQHNLKEEGMLYPMAEDLLGGPRWSDLARRVRAAIEQPFS
jgi:hemerythrin-like domain-containing protein